MFHALILLFVQQSSFQLNCYICSFNNSILFCRSLLFIRKNVISYKYFIIIQKLFVIEKYHFRSKTLFSLKNPIFIQKFYFQSITFQFLHTGMKIIWWQSQRKLFKQEKLKYSRNISLDQMGVKLQNMVQNRNVASE